MTDHIDLNWVREHAKNIRIHGNGFIQADVGKGERIHIFGHPGVPRQIEPTPIHDHRFGFKSTVVFGSLVNVWYKFQPVSEDHRATHFACTFEPSRPGSEDTKLIAHRDKTCIPFLFNMVLKRSGAQYIMRPGEFHETLTNEPTITFMQKTVTDERLQPRVLCRIGHDPDNGFDRDGALGHAEMIDIIEDTFERAGRTR